MTSLAPTPVLEVRFVRSLAEGLDDAIGFLEATVSSRPESIFDQATVVVPSVGVREWLTEQVALRLGATHGRDGVAANISFRFPGVLDHFMPGRPEDDPWSVPAMTAALLRLCGGGKWREHLAARVSSAGGPLRFAHKMADRFDRYHARRPAMIRLWEKGAWSLAPVADGPDDGMSAVLSDHDRWQFDLWRDLRVEIGVPSLPSRLEAELADPSPSVRGALPSRLLVFGFSALGQHQIEVLRAIARYSAVTVVFVHPSPVLARAWQQTPTSSEGVDALPMRVIPSLPEELATSVLPLAFGWLRATRETQVLFGRAGIACVSHRPVTAPAPRNLLQRLQVSVRDGLQPGSALPERDDSLRLHRCHGPARQAEVAHDAIVQALQDDPTLQLHEIAVMSPDIERMAPYLRATFGQTYTDSRGEKCAIPLVVADRALQRVDDGSRVFVEFLRVASGRVDAASVQALIGDPALLAAHDVEDPDRWWQWLSRAEQRWGVDADHRARAGVGIVDDDGLPDHRHTWLHTVRRLIVGAVADHGTAVGGACPLSDVEVDELPSVLRLSSLVAALSALVDAGAEPRTPREWAEVIEDAFVGLCGEESSLLGVPSEELRGLARLGEADRVPFADVVGYLSNRFEGVPDARLSRFGGVVATSMSSQRLVPYRMICLVGVDDEALGSGDSEGDDLIGRQHLVGDPDPRAEHRRAVLDAVLSSSDRLVICCNGQSLKNNDPVPTPVPLSELLDACRALGAAPRDPVRLELEVVHPRHSLSARNFRSGGVVTGRVWSYAADARDLAHRIALGGAPVSTGSWVPGSVHESPSRLSVNELVAALQRPLTVFLEHSLKVSHFDLTAGSAVSPVDEVPLWLDGKRRSSIAGSGLIARDHGAWRADLNSDRSREVLPVTAGARARATDEVEELVAAVSEALPRGSWTAVGEARSVELPVGGGVVVTASLPMEIELTSDVVVKQTKATTVQLERGTRWFLDASFREKQPTHWDIARQFVLLVVAAADGWVGNGTLCAAGYGRPPRMLLHHYEFPVPPTQDEARTWLDGIASIHRLAALNPIPHFGGLAVTWAKAVTASPPDDAACEATRDAIASGDFNDADTTRRSVEQLVCGERPDIDAFIGAAAAICAHESLMARWWAAPSTSGAGYGKVPKRPFFRVGMRVPTGMARVGGS